MMVQEAPAPVTVRDGEAVRRRRGRSWALLIALFGICLLFYAITIVKMAHL
jgi:hypothetical protein